MPQGTKREPYGVQDFLVSTMALVYFLQIALDCVKGLFGGILELGEGDSSAIWIWGNQYLSRVWSNRRGGEQRVSVSVLAAMDSRALTNRSIVVWTSSTLLARFPVVASLSCSCIKVSMTRRGARSGIYLKQAERTKELERSP